MKLPITPRLKYNKLLRTTTLRDFSGGWNALDDDMNLSYKFATQLYNVYPRSDGTLAVRYGTTLFAKCATKFNTPAYIVNVEYFAASLIVVGSNGEVLRILGDGTVIRIFDTLIAATLPGAPAGWGPTEFVSFAQFNGHLIIANGSDKPLDIDSSFTVEYLQDAATNSNLNVPIARYVVAINRYLVMAGDPLELDRVHISAKDAAGTWYGDPPPNDATRIDVGSVLSSANTIRGLMPFRGRLVVMFAEGLVFGELGIYDDNGNHTPNFDDGVEGFGSISHRAGIAYGDDGLFMDLEGVPSIKRTVLSASFKPERISDLIDPEIKRAISPLNFITLEDRVFSVYNKSDAQFMLFVPNNNQLANTTETRCFVYNYRPALHQEAWCEFRGWNFTCGCKSLQGDVFFGDAEGNIWLYGNEDRPLDADYTDMISLVPDTEGTPISFSYTMPWLDFGVRGNSKHSKYISFDTRGASEFTVDMFVDNLSDAVLSMEFSAGEQGQFGGGPQPYGGGRNTSRKKLYAWPAKFQIAKLKFSGQANAGWGLTSITVHYLEGGIRR